jgi:hypothetical protein
MRWVLGDVGQHIGEPCLGIDAVHIGRDDQAVHGSGATAATIYTLTDPPCATAFAAWGREEECVPSNGVVIVVSFEIITLAGLVPRLPACPVFGLRLWWGCVPQDEVSS